jgi:hypothetical protein
MSHKNNHYFRILIDSIFKVISTVALLHSLMKTVLKDFPLAITYLMQAQAETQYFHYDIYITFPYLYAKGQFKNM